MIGRINSNTKLGIYLPHSSNNSLINNTPDTGIGTDPRQIPGGGGSVDNCPLMQPWTAASQKGDLNGYDQITPADAADVSGGNRVTSLDVRWCAGASCHTSEVLPQYAYRITLSR